MRQCKNLLEIDTVGIDHWHHRGDAASCSLNPKIFGQWTTPLTTLLSVHLRDGGLKDGHHPSVEFRGENSISVSSVSILVQYAVGKGQGLLKW